STGCTIDNQSIAPFARAIYPSRLVAIKTENLGLIGVILLSMPLCPANGVGPHLLAITSLQHNADCLDPDCAKSLPSICLNAQSPTVLVALKAAEITSDVDVLLWPRTLALEVFDPVGSALSGEVLSPFERRCFVGAILVVSSGACLLDELLHGGERAR